jgi:glycosyltransferase involved in cell wall biosynthesis
MSSTHRQPLVSVVMIFWNAAAAGPASRPTAFMDEAIRSVLDQELQPIELLLCDDGSDDASTALARAWADRLPHRVRYLEHPNHVHAGMSATRNLGLAAAEGRALAFLDADDVWLPEHLARYWGSLEQHPEAAAVCGRALDWHSWDNAGRADVWSELPWPSGTVVDPPAMLLAVLRRGAYSTPVCSLLVRREVAQELGGSEAAFTGMYEDQVLLSKLYLTRTIVLEDAPTALYRQHAGSSTAQAIRQGLYHPGSENPSREVFLRWLVKQQSTGAEPDPQVAAALQASLRPYDRSYARLRWRSLALARALRQRARQALNHRVGRTP